MTAPSQPPPPVEAASWPFNCLCFYSHVARDFGRYAQAMSKTTDVMEAARAENDFGVRLFGDLMQAYYDLALAPWTMMASAMAQRAADVPPPAEIKTARPRGRQAG